MIIHKITLHDVAQAPVSGAYVATVRMMASDGPTLTLRAASLPTEAKASNADAQLARALAQDAIRQLRRMPEYRKDASLLTVIDAAWPSATGLQTPVLS